jgi:hypothetical protein
MMVFKEGFLIPNTSLEYWDKPLSLILLVGLLDGSSFIP